MGGGNLEADLRILEFDLKEQEFGAQLRGSRQMVRGRKFQRDDSNKKMRTVFFQSSFYR